MPIRDRYPGSDILAQRGHWDEATRKVILDRVHNVPKFRHFDAHQRETLEALCARVVPQDHRPADRRVPIAPWIDSQLAQPSLEGFRFEDMPPGDQAWAWGLAGLDQSARERFGKDFAALDATQQDEVLQAIRQGEGSGDAWRQMSPKRWWRYVVLRQIVGIYYAHPNAWDEIGFGGPAYPRGYYALNFGAPEAWEAREAPSPDWRSTRSPNENGRDRNTRDGNRRSGNRRNGSARGGRPA